MMQHKFPCKETSQVKHVTMVKPWTMKREWDAASRCHTFCIPVITCIPVIVCVCFIVSESTTLPAYDVLSWHWTDFTCDSWCIHIHAFPQRQNYDSASRSLFREPWLDVEPETFWDLSIFRDLILPDYFSGNSWFVYLCSNTKFMNLTTK